MHNKTQVIAYVAKAVMHDLYTNHMIKTCVLTWLCIVRESMFDGHCKRKRTTITNAAFIFITCLMTVTVTENIQRQWDNRFAVEFYRSRVKWH